MKTQKSKLFEFSHFIYNTNQLNELYYSINNVTDVHQQILGSQIYKVIKQFQESNLTQQRELLDKSPKEIIHAFLDSVFLLDTDRSVLLMILAYIDSFIFCCFTR